MKEILKILWYFCIKKIAKKSLIHFLSNLWHFSKVSYVFQASEKFGFLKFARTFHILSFPRKTNNFGGFNLCFSGSWMNFWQKPLFYIPKEVNWGPESIQMSKITFFENRKNSFWFFLNNFAIKLFLVIVFPDRPDFFTQNEPT